MKMKPEMPPQIDTSVTDRTAEKEGVTDEANVGKTVLGTGSQ